MRCDITKEICPVSEENGMYHLHFYKVSFSRKDFIDHFFDPSLLAESYSTDEMQILLDEILPDATDKLRSYALVQEKKYLNSVSFTAGGACKKCKTGCANPLDQPCRFPESLRYSVESLGINAAKVTETLFDSPLIWPSYDRLPAYLTFISGLLKADR